MDATINFRTGVAVFRKISAQHVKLDRSPSNHLLLPLTAFAGRCEVLQSLQVDVEDASARNFRCRGTGSYRPLRARRGIRKPRTALQSQSRGSSTET